MTTFFCAAATVGLLLSTASVSAAGIASSTQPFDLMRGGTEYTSASNAVMNSGDALSATGSAVQLEFAGGNSVLIDEGSRASLLGTNRLELHEGAVIAGKRGQESMTVSHADLNIESIGAAENPGTLYVGTMPNGNVRVASFNGNFAVTETGREQGLAALGGGDAVELQQTSQGWRTVGDAGPPPEGQLQIVERGHLDQDREPGLLLFWMHPATLGVAAAIGGGTLLYYWLDDDDDDDKRRRRPPVSPVTITDIE